ncbi:hypothetical protein Slala02_65100 [Streptomyces lavendulae subsp. lavendulae]|nr:hypothetical protein Slala01_68710 [Streptomyces lavendulae subsp. lavendulae]GLX30690.1 hypothetical protein Slala02_65100 [Streptomyces lavendulae subsp. lavendulae]
MRAERLIRSGTPGQYGPGAPLEDVVVLDERTADDERWSSWPEAWVGTDCDVRTVLGAIPREVKDAFRYDEIPWERFPHFYGTGAEVPGLLRMLASDDAEAAGRALRRLWTTVHHQGSTIEVAALAVPFLLRIAAAGHPGLRADTLTLVAVSGRRQHLGDGTREGLLQVAEDPLLIGPVECPVDWTVQAARDAVTSDLHLPLSLLPDPDPKVRSAAAFVLALATGEVPRVRSALRERLVVEDEPAVQVGLVLAVAQLAREQRDGSARDWVRELWSDPGRPPHVRVGAGLAWLCLVDSPAPYELRALLTDPGVRRHGDLFQQVPWISPVDSGDGLRRCIEDMLTPSAP